MKKPFNADASYPLAIGMGLIEGVRAFALFGSNEIAVADTETDLSKGLVGTVTDLPSFAGESLEIVSDASTDTDTVLIYALGPGCTTLEPIEVTLTGTTPVVIPGNISRVNGAQSSGVDGFTGTLTVRPAGGGSTFLTLDPDDQRSSQAVYTIPAGWRAQVTALVGTMQKSGGQDTDALVNLRLKGSENLLWQKPFGFGLQRSGDTSIQFENGYPGTIEGPSDLKITLTSSNTGLSAAGWVGGVLTSKGEQ